MGSFDTAQDERKKAKYESPKARLARVRREAKAEAFLNRQLPLGGDGFASFLRFG